LKTSLREVLREQELAADPNRGPDPGRDRGLLLAGDPEVTGPTLAEEKSPSLNQGQDQDPELSLSPDLHQDQEHVPDQDHVQTDQDHIQTIPKVTGLGPGAKAGANQEMVTSQMKKRTIETKFGKCFYECSCLRYRTFVHALYFLK